MESVGRESVELDELDRRIVAALQVNGRASWRRIAGVLGEPERTVARRGARLLSTGQVVVHGLVPRGEMVILRLRCTPGALRVAAATLARRDDTTFTYVITGAADCAAEISCPPHRMESLLMDELPGIPGLVSSDTNPALRYFRAVHDWRPGLLSSEEIDGLSDFPRITALPMAHDEPLGREDRILVRLLTEDGRRPGEELSMLSGISEPTVRRRIEAMRRQGRLFLRAVVEPALLGLPTEALLWMKVAPGRVDAVGEELARSGAVRYAVALAGEYQLLVHVAVRDTVELHRFITTGSWVRDTQTIETSMIVAAPKRTGVLHRSLRDDR